MPREPLRNPRAVARRPDPIATHGRAIVSLTQSCFRPSLLRSVQLTPNPSIEGMPKRLRLLCTPHVKR
jgi:hypothetical protein